MNDQELITAVRESFAYVHSTTPVEQIVSRGRAAGARRRIPVLAGALAAMIAAALAVTALLASSHQPTAQLAAWTVSKQADGTIYVTIRQLRDPAGLQRTLRADGVPASVTYLSQHNNPSCLPYPNGVTPAGQLRPAMHRLVQISRRQGTAVLVLHPTALPSGAGLQLGRIPSYLRHPNVPIVIGVGLVQASPKCTGS